MLQSILGTSISKASNVHHSLPRSYLKYHKISYECHVALYLKKKLFTIHVSTICQSTVRINYPVSLNSMFKFKYMFLFSTLSKRDCGAETNLLSLLKVSDVVLPDAVDVTALPWPKWLRQWLKASDRNLPPICPICAQPLQTHRVQQPQQPQSFVSIERQCILPVLQILPVPPLRPLLQGALTSHEPAQSQQAVRSCCTARTFSAPCETKTTLRSSILQSWFLIFQFNSNMASHGILRKKNVHKMQNLIHYKIVMMAFLCVLACGSMLSAIAEEPETVQNQVGCSMWPQVQSHRS